MTTLKFADTHNMVVFLAKPVESEGFEQIVDFLNAHTIKYALKINPTIYTSCIEQFWATVKAKTINGEVQLQALIDGKKIIITESIVRRDLQLEDAKGVDCLPNATIFEQLTFLGGPTTNVADEAVNKEMDDSLVRVATTASSLEAEQDNGNIDKTQSKATPNEPSSLGTSSSGGPRRQETMGDTITKTRSENVSKLSNNSLFARGNTLRSGEDSLKLQELMALCTTLQSRVLALETTNTTQANEIAFNAFDKTLLDEITKGRIAYIDVNKDIYLVNVHTDEDMFGVNDLDGDEVIVDNIDVVKTAKETRSVVEEVTVVIEIAKLVSAAEEIVNVAATTVSIASTIPVKLKSAKPKADKVVRQEPKQGTTTTTLTTIISLPKPPHEKRKGIMIEELVVEQVKPMKRLEQIRLDEELAFKLQAEEEKEKERLAKEKAQQMEEANIAWDDVQAKIEVDYQLAQRLQAQEQEELTNEEKARLFIQFLEQRRQHFVAKRAEEKRNRPPTRAQQRSIMCTYLKNMERWKPKSLKNKSFANIQELFDKAMKKVNTFVDYRTELVEENSKKAEAEIA
ncbi:hypothetical protein Tco_1307963 [Tanacetum coccineum]